MKIKINDTGEIVNVNSAKEFVSWLNKTAKTPSINDFMYMREYARRAVIMSNQDIRATSPEEFFEDLLKHKHIKILDAILPN
ncbi:hypothetical protein [Riemerella anatipestifer]|uniref:hypothetical protein n=1 Tax=Riemerella anatipestifer TaxID=34085 RepID=UPI00129D7F1F|nr:hypothetical protein [Riemerella anatipestifer]MRM96422.1 hypothetical protein [Riemerella anatipestifer]